MEIMLFFSGALVSWLITHWYQLRSSKETPDWAKPLVAEFPKNPPASDELERIVSKFINAPPVLEHGSNANGEYIRYANGEQVCKGSVVIGPGHGKVKVSSTFPAVFDDKPAIELSGEVVRIISKTATAVSLEIEVDID